MSSKTERIRKPLKKTALKSIIALVLCMATMIGSIGAGTNTASAASKKIPLTITFKGKNVKFSYHYTQWPLNNTTHPFTSTSTVNKIAKKWGKPKKNLYDKSVYGGSLTYTWKKGKSSIKCSDNNTGNGKVNDLFIDISDKNISVCGVKVGTKKDQAIKKLKKATGLKVKTEKMMNNKSVLCVGPKHEKYMSCFDGGNWFPQFILKNGKVSYIGN